MILIFFSVFYLILRGFDGSERSKKASEIFKSRLISQFHPQNQLNYNFSPIMRVPCHPIIEIFPKLNRINLTLVSNWNRKIAWKWFELQIIILEKNSRESRILLDTPIFHWNWFFNCIKVVKIRKWETIKCNKIHCVIHF